MTNDLKRRIWEHKNKVHEGFTKRYNVTRLVYFEELDGLTSAILREKQIKKCARAKKVELIESLNPNWDDLSLAIWDDHYPES